SMRLGRAAARRTRWLVLVLVAPLALARPSFGVAQPVGAASDSTLGPPIPQPVGFVNDQAQVMEESQRAQLEAFLDQVRRKTGAEFAVLTMKTTAPATPSEYKVRVFERWGRSAASAVAGWVAVVGEAACGCSPAGSGAWGAWEALEARVASVVAASVADRSAVSEVA